MRNTQAILKHRHRTEGFDGSLLMDLGGSPGLGSVLLVLLVLLRLLVLLVLHSLLVLLLLLLLLRQW